MHESRLELCKLWGLICSREAPRPCQYKDWLVWGLSWLVAATENDLVWRAPLLPQLLFGPAVEQSGPAVSSTEQSGCRPVKQTSGGVISTLSYYRILYRRFYSRFTGEKTTTVIRENVEILNKSLSTPPSLLYCCSREFQFPESKDPPISNAKCE